MGPLGGTELLVIFIIILLLFGPSQIPKMARGLGQAMREFKKAQREISDEVTREDAPPSNPASKPPDNKPVG
jgi:sec-independent protein translocase protein TatA